MFAFKNLHSSEKDFIKIILDIVSTRYDMNTAELYDLFDLEYSHPLERIVNIKCNYDSNKCHAVLTNNKQCSRKIKLDLFCLTHQKQDKSKMKLINSESNGINRYIEKMREVRKIPKLIECQYINVDNIDYLYDPFDDSVYHFDTYQLIGKLDPFNQLKKIKYL